MPIDHACAADDAARVHRHLAGAGECRIDSAGGDKIIYTYHLPLFGTALPERAAPPPVVDTCSVSVGDPDLRVSARPGGHSAPARQVVTNSGSAPFASVDLAATTWQADSDGTLRAATAPPPPPAPVAGTNTGSVAGVNTATLVWSLPASATELSTAGAGGAYVPLAEGMAVAGGLGGGETTPLWFRINLAPYGEVQAGALVQTVTYQAVCSAP